MQSASNATETFLYQQVIELIRDHLNSGDLRPGDKLPSLRQLSERMEVSVPTVRQAYLELERQGVIEARAKSGYFVRPASHLEPVLTRRSSARPAEVTCLKLIDRVYDVITQPHTVPFAIANPSMALPAVKILNRAMRRVMAKADERQLNYAAFTGEPLLKRQLGYRWLEQGCDVTPDDILITNGAQEALSIALQTVAKAGDVIAVESPTYHGLLELIESLGMLALEIETDPTDGICLNALEMALDKHNIAACMFSSALNNPLGSTSCDKKRQQLVALLERRNVPLIEDDVYSDLLFDGRRPRSCYFYSRKGLVFSAGSFSKTIAPGYRIGWLLRKQCRARSVRLKRALSCSSGVLQQLVLADVLASGDFDRHLKRLKEELQQNCARMQALICRHFPAGTRCTQPKGGAVLWLELPDRMDGDQVFERAAQAGISLMPGRLFGAGDRYRHFIRISFGLPWSTSVEEATAKLGRICEEFQNSV